MSEALSARNPRFSLGGFTVGFGTVITALVPPSPGAAGGPAIYSADGKFRLSMATKNAAAWTHIDHLIYSVGAGAHTIYLMRPLNWTTTSADAATGQTVINITDDPGIYSTNYKYPTPGGIASSVVGGSGGQGGVAPCQVTDTGIAANHYVAYQLQDGTWFSDTVASVATLALTMNTNIPAGTATSKLPKGTVMYLFGLKTSKDPATGLAHWNTKPTASTNRINLLGDDFQSGFESLHPGDPILVLSDNVTATGFFDLIAGEYRRP